MDNVTTTKIFASSCSSSSFDRSSPEIDEYVSWKESSHERSKIFRQVRDKKMVTSVISPGTVTRRSKNINRSPRQARRNERERGRKARLNTAFKVLRNVIPFYTDGLSKEKLTQVQVLRLAAKYIMTLSDVLGSESSENEDNEYYSSQLREYHIDNNVIAFIDSS